MTLVYGPSALCFAPEGTETVLAGVGPFVRVIRNSESIAEHRIFEMNQRICGISRFEKLIMASAENVLKIVQFSDDYETYEVVREWKLVDCGRCLCGGRQ